MTTFITKKLKPLDITNSIKKDFLIKYPKTDKIKIEIKFYDDKGNLLKPFFYFITKNFKNPKINNFIKASYLKFNQKNLHTEAVKYEVNIISLQ